jgi:hypothetical protein
MATLEKQSPLEVKKMGMGIEDVLGLDMKKYLDKKNLTEKLEEGLIRRLVEFSCFPPKIGDYIKKHWERFDEDEWEKVKYISVDIRIANEKIEETITELNPEDDKNLIRTLGFLREKLDGLILIADDTLTFRSIVSEIRTSRKIVPNSEIMEKVKRLIANGKAKAEERKDSRSKDKH